MTSHARDRREWGVLGLVVLGYGLVLSPVVHAVLQHGSALGPDGRDIAWVTHQVQGGAPRAPLHAQPHRHEGPAGSVEHLTVMAPGAVAAPVVAPPAWTVAWTVEGEVRARAGRVVRPRAMPQGP